MKDNLPYRSRQEFELTFKFPATVVYEQFLHINSWSWKRTLLGGRHESRNFTVYNFAGLGAEARRIVLAKQRDVQKKMTTVESMWLKATHVNMYDLAASYKKGRQTKSTSGSTQCCPFHCSNSESLFLLPDPGAIFSRWRWCVQLRLSCTLIPWRYQQLLSRTSRVSAYGPATGCEGQAEEGNRELHDGISNVGGNLICQVQTIPSYEGVQNDSSAILKKLFSARKVLLWLLTFCTIV